MALGTGLLAGAVDLGTAAMSAAAMSAGAAVSAPALVAAAAVVTVVAGTGEWGTRHVDILLEGPEGV